MTADRPRGQLRDFFTGLAEYAFETRLGLADPPLVDYLAELLVRFIRTDTLYAVRNSKGRRLDQVVDLLAEAEARVGDARREVHRHVGDFALFWTGVYPEALAHLQAGSKRDYFVDYCEQGKRAYYIASTIPAADDTHENQVLERLSHEFEMCAYGLGEVRREWERRDPGTASQLMLLN